MLERCFRGQSMDRRIPSAFVIEDTTQSLVVHMQCVCVRRQDYAAARAER